MSYVLHLLIYGCIYTLLAVSLDLVVGYAGLLSLAHASFFAAGAYAFALAILKLELGILPALLLAFLAGGALSFALSTPARRLRGDFFVLLSLAVQALFFNILLNWHDPSAPLGSLRNMTNGLFGIGGIPRGEILGIRFDTLGSVLVLALVVTGALLALASRLTKSPWGRLVEVIRDDELAARSLGKSPSGVKSQTLLLSGGMAAVGGAIYSLYVGYVDPSLASLDMSVLLLSMLLIGGTGNLLGPALGAAILLLLPELLHSIRFSEALADQVRLLAYGLLLVVFVHFRPQGIAGARRID
jgi:branched-chain amino acid transport system permease protein